MQQRKLYKTIEKIASQAYRDEKEMLIEVINQIVKDENINIDGGRIWKLEPDKKQYILLYQTGRIDKIEPKFSVKLKEYPIFELISKNRTVSGKETNRDLRRKGIFKYSASGVGNKIKVEGKFYYEYLLALSGNRVDDDFLYTLNIIATALTSQIKQKKYSQKTKKLLEGLDQARDLQKSILPEHKFIFHDYEVFGLTYPAEIVGGDFFDYLEIGDDGDRLGVTVCDAASKGVSASAEAMYISGALRMASSFEIKISPLMKRMNLLVNKIFADDKFASMFYGELSTDKSGLFLYANAGHNPPLFIKNTTKEVLLLNPTGPVLGPAPHIKFCIDSINFQKNDVLLIFSDGVIDSTDKDFNPYGDERLVEKIKSLCHLSPEEIAYSILKDVILFSKDGKYSDDKTLVVIKKVK